jgi:4-diphosphocytidyl-2-C-methyl-D-erythritol kinase
LSRVGLTLGADVPMCLAGRALRARGVGEEIESLADWPALPLVLVWPGRPVSTPEAFKSLARRDNPPLTIPPNIASVREVAVWLGACRNDLERPALALELEIGTVLTALRAAADCLLARMSGSGSACFGLYAERAAAEQAAAALSAEHPQWWVAATAAG